ncbi:hypothetical protein C3L33_20890, partial [Rhododendron williamsianum]
SLIDCPPTQPPKIQSTFFPPPPSLPQPKHQQCSDRPQDLLSHSFLSPPQPQTNQIASTPIRNALALPFLSLPFPVPRTRRLPPLASSSTFVEQLADSADNESFEFDASFESPDMKKQAKSPPLEVRELEELPEQWRRTKLAWLCKELPAHKASMLVRILNAQRKWIRQEDGTYVAVHCMRIRENETGFRVYKWMMQQHWFRFDFALATKLADFLGKERKYLKCREIFDDIINQGRVPACSIYNRMIQLGGYKPPLSLHNSLFRALVSNPGGSSKKYLKQAEFIYHNLVTSELEIHKDIYGGLIWLHSYQDNIDKERIESLRSELQVAGIQERREVLVSILRACSKDGDVQEAERVWLKLIHCEGSLPYQAFVYRMGVYAKVGQPLKSLEIFRRMQEHLGSTNVVAYLKIIEVLSKAQKIELAESLMGEFMESGLKPIGPSFVDLMDMYFSLDLHDKLESTFSQSLEKCRPNRTIYNIYLDSLVKTGNIGKAEEIFNQMLSNGTIGVNTRSSNSILSCYLSNGEYVKAEKIYDLMCQKKYDVEPPLMEKLDYVMSLSKKVVKKPVSLKLSVEQREILMGLLLGGLRIESDEAGKKHALHFVFSGKLDSHTSLKRHIYDQQFWPKGQAVIPKLIHRWLSPRVLAYWYMFAGYRTSSGDILLKVKGSQEGVERIVKALKAKSLDCKVKRKGRVFWWPILERISENSFGGQSDSDDAASDYSDHDYSSDF